MVYNISIFFLWICVLLSITDLQIVKLHAVQNPCSDITPQGTIADMCTKDYATENNETGGTTVDSVALRVTTQQEGCMCEVTLESQQNISALYMRKYDALISAAPQQDICGLAIDVEYNLPHNLPETEDPLECTRGTNTRSITLYKDGVLRFKSRIIAGYFSRGYCIQIYRQHQPGDTSRLQLHCRQHGQYLTTTPDKNITQYKESVAENGNIQIPVIIVAVLGWCLTALFAIITLCLYRRINKQRPNNSGAPNVNALYQDLHVTRLSSCYSSLNALAINSEQHEHI